MKLRILFKQALAITIGMVFLFVQNSALLEAAPSQDVRQIRRGQPFYVPCLSVGSQTSPTENQPAVPGSVYMLSDLVGEGIGEQLDTALERITTPENLASPVDANRWSVTENAQADRTLEQGISAAAEVPRDQKYVVVVLGSNSLESTTNQADITALITALRAKNVGTIFWLKINVTAGDLQSGAVAFNQLLGGQQQSLTLLNNTAQLQQDGITPSDKPALAQSMATQIAAPPRELSTSTANACSPCPAGGASGYLSTNVPDPWRSLILEASSEYPDVDPRIVAAVLGVEHNIGGSGQWPEYQENWAESGAGARGPFQFIAGTWFGRSFSSIARWNWDPAQGGRDFRDESNYSPSGMGTDGDGDGIRDPSNPRDSVHAAFKHHLGSAGKPIAVTGFSPTATLEENLRSTRFEREDTNLLYYGAKYNGSGAAVGATLESLRGRGQNSNYVVAVFTLLFSDFTKAYNYGNNTFADLDGSIAGDASASSNGCPEQASGNFVWPVQNKVYPLTACWGDRRQRNNSTYFHSGLDIGAPEGEPVLAAAAGTVVFYSTTDAGYGNVIAIDHGNGYWTHYGHMRSAPLVNQGDTVTSGQQVGEVGNTGSSAGNHLHFNMYNNFDNGISSDGNLTINPFTNGLEKPAETPDNAGCLNFPEGGRCSQQFAPPNCVDGEVRPSGPSVEVGVTQKLLSMNELIGGI